MGCSRVGHNSKRDENCGLLFLRLGIMTLHSQWYVYNCVIQVKKSMANLSFTRDLHGLNTRNTDDFDQPYCHLSRTANGFPNLAIKVYNSMRMEIKSATTVFATQLSRELKSRPRYSVRELFYDLTSVWTN